MLDEISNAENQRLGVVISHTGKELQKNGIGGDERNFEHEYAEFLASLKGNNVAGQIQSQLQNTDWPESLKGRLIHEAAARRIKLEL